MKQVFNLSNPYLGGSIDYPMENYAVSPTSRNSPVHAVLCCLFQLARLLNRHSGRKYSVDGFKVLKTIMFSFAKDCGSVVSKIQLMEEDNVVLVPVRCSD